MVFPLYPLAPEKNCLDTTNSIFDLYKEIASKYDGDVVIMGDSSGGGLSILTCIYANKDNLIMPKSMILFSPWVDLSLTNEKASKLIKIDPMIGLEGLIQCRDAWIGDVSMFDERINPMCASVKSIPNTYIFVGTRELAYPDVIRFYDKTYKVNDNISLIIGKNMNHNFVLYPMPQSVLYRNKVLKIIDGVDEK